MIGGCEVEVVYLRWLSDQRHNWAPGLWIVRVMTLGCYLGWSWFESLASLCEADDFEVSMVADILLSSSHDIFLLDSRIIRSQSHVWEVEKNWLEDMHSIQYLSNKKTKSPGRHVHPDI